MSGRRRGGGRWPERTAAAGDDGNGYVEIDPTGRYGRFEELLGKGAMKSVYRGFDEERGVEVAWNQANLADVLRSPDALQRIYSEVHLLSTLRHDAIIAFHASWVDAGRRTFNFITELFSSGTLRSFRLRYPRVSLRAVKHWARQILAGLAFLHGHRPPVIHRDLKCDNIFVNGHLGQVKIGDLGLAAVLRGSRAAHSVIGTPEFMAPELYEEEYDQLVDVYSFGMCMLEMLTVEYPYAECSNPAQIYKKVTAGKLPDAFYRVHDRDARRFVGRCLLAAASRPSAAELLLDPFLRPGGHDDASSFPRVMPSPSPSPAISCTVESRSHSGGVSCDDSLDDDDDDDEEGEDEGRPAAARTDMTITGKLNTEDDTVFLKVQIGDEAGHVRNIYFPFDMAGDTAAEVAAEMVKELDIHDRDPSEIAAMIEQEIARLVPGWAGADEQQESYTYGDDDPPYYYLSSSPASSQGSLCAVGPSTSGGPHGCFQDCCCYPLSSDEDDASSSSAAPPYCSARSVDGDDAPPHPHQAGASSSSKTATRFRPRARPEQASLAGGGQGQPAQAAQRQCSMSPRPHGARERDGERRRATMTRNRSMVEMRSQLLHRTLVEELNKRLFFNTVGAVEDIGFRAPSYGGADHRRRAGKEKHRYM